MPGCPNGCPCPNYDCQPDAALPNSVLVLYGNTKALVTDVNGAEIALNWMADGDVDTRSFCSLVFEDAVYIFGQVSAIELSVFCFYLKTW